MNETNQTKKINGRFTDWWRRLSQNPVAIKEFRSQMRGRRAFALLSVYTFLMSGFIGLVYLGLEESSHSSYGPSPQEIGKTIFGIIWTIQMFVGGLIGTAFAASSITGERERQTYQLLRTTSLSAADMVKGKLIASLSYAWLLLGAAVPLLSVSLFLGGLSGGEFVMSQLVVAVATIYFTTIGIYFSATMKSTMAATMSSYLIIGFTTIGLPMFVWFGGAISSFYWLSINEPSGISLIILIYLGIILAAANLPATAISTELILYESGSLWGLQETVDGLTIWFISPWPLFLLFHLIFAWLWYRGAVRAIARIPRQ